MFLSSDNVHNGKLKEVGGNEFLILSCLESLIIRGWTKYPLLQEIKKDYYDKGYLAACMSVNNISKFTGLSISTIRRQLNSLEKKGFIYKYSTLMDVDQGSITKSRINIYVIGEWKMINNERKEKLYFTHKKLEEKSVVQTEVPEKKEENESVTQKVDPKKHEELMRKLQHVFKG